jgi:hypothetical protein
VRDRLNKSKIKIDDFQERIVKRTDLLNQVTREISRRKTLALKLTEKDKLLRKRLIRNTEMKSAIQNLAEIAGYKLNRGKFLVNRIKSKNRSLSEDDEKEEMNTETNGYELKITKNNSYTVYIEMAYNEVDEILARDKQIIIELIRRKKNNDFKLKELLKLRVKVIDSLAKLKDFDAKLSEIIQNNSNIENILSKLARLSRFSSNQKMLTVIQNMFDEASDKRKNIKIKQIDNLIPEGEQENFKKESEIDNEETERLD